TVTITVDPVADALDDAITTDEDVAATFNVLSGITAGSPDGATADTFGGPATITGVSATSNGGTVAFTASGAITYTPPAGFSGTDTFTYTVDNNGSDETATVTMTIAAV
ncbi:Ig-like domain-containing protein, partial [Ahrensia sp. R2A130]|uniref:Ig-like domain-containing protein n=1 Tax=Ahrensia sp. R2A130 TaxID=744979 RepID=UPI0001E0C351